jgi:hypothetical protein
MSKVALGAAFVDPSGSFVTRVAERDEFVVVLGVVVVLTDPG